MNAQVGTYLHGRFGEHTQPKRQREERKHIYNACSSTTLASYEATRSALGFSQTYCHLGKRKTAREVPNALQSERCLPNHRSHSLRAFTESVITGGWVGFGEGSAWAEGNRGVGSTGTYSGVYFGRSGCFDQGLERRPRHIEGAPKGRSA